MILHIFAFTVKLKRKMEHLDFETWTVNKDLFCLFFFIDFMNKVYYETEHVSCVYKLLCLDF